MDANRGQFDVIFLDIQMRILGSGKYAEEQNPAQQAVFLE